MHRADYRAWLHTQADDEQLREEIDRAAMWLSVPITEEADFDMAKSAVLDLLDILEEIQCRAITPGKLEARP